MQQVTSVVGATKRNRLFIYFYDYTGFDCGGKGMCICVGFLVKRGSRLHIQVKFKAAAISRCFHQIHFTSYLLVSYKPSPPAK
jgi:hypothetical protein